MAFPPRFPKPPSPSPRAGRPPSPPPRALLSDAGASYASQQSKCKGKDNWKCTNMHFESVLNLNEESINVIARRAYSHLCFGDCKQILSVALICRV
jgi:hypothetical protein